MLLEATGGRVRAARSLTLPLDFTRVLHEAILEQARFTYDPGEERRALEALLRRCPTPGSLVGYASARATTWPDPSRPGPGRRLTDPAPQCGRARPGLHNRPAARRSPVVDRGETDHASLPDPRGERPGLPEAGRPARARGRARPGGRPGPGGVA